MLASARLRLPVFEADGGNHETPDEVIRRTEIGHDDAGCGQLRAVDGITDEPRGIVERQRTAEATHRVPEHVTGIRRIVRCTERNFGIATPRRRVLQRDRETRRPLTWLEAREQD